jgi:hypothetical protein
VFGLIAAFRQAAELGMDDPRNFAAGIYEALYTTAFGLVVAIPLLIIYHMLRNHADNIMRDVEERALAFISAASSRAPTPRNRAGGQQGAARGRESERFGETETETEEDPDVDDGEQRADDEETNVDELETP